MSQLTIDTNDNVNVLRACRNMLNELLGEPALVPTHVGGAPKLTEVPHMESTEETQAPAGNTGATAGQVDLNGVGFNGDFCGVSKDPFYGSGKRKGRWKKRRGITDDAYDAWYESQRDADTGQAAKDDDSVNTAGAFGGADDTQAAATAPTDCGSFMGWVSNKQAAGLLTQEDVGEAYVQAGVQITDLFPPNDANTVAQHVNTLYTILASKAGA